MMADALSAQTGLRVSCCQASVAGIPWGMAEYFFSANNEPARKVLKRLMAADSVNQPNRDYGLERCTPLPSTWCFINLTHPAEAISALQTQPFGTLDKGARCDMVHSDSSCAKIADTYPGKNWICSNSPPAA
jgi:hypothetical protein